MTDHEFEKCGAGSLTSDAACMAVREIRGGRRDRCHYLLDDGAKGMCQLPEDEHEVCYACKFADEAAFAGATHTCDIPRVTDAERREASALVQVLSAVPGDVDY